MTRSFGRPRPAAVSLLVTLAVGQAAGAVLIAHAVHRLIDAHDALAAALATILGLAAASYAAEVVQRRLAEGVGLSCVAEIRTALFRHLLQVSPELIARRRHGAMLQSFVGDLTAARQWISDGIIRGGVAALMLVTLTTWIGRTNGALATVLALVVIGSVAIGAMLLIPLHQAVREVRRERGRLSAFASERLGATASIIACGRARSELRKLDRQQERLIAAGLHRAWFTGLLRGLPHFTTTVLMLVTVLMAQGNSAGAIAGSLTLIGLVGLGLRDLARAAELWIPGRIAKARIAALMALPAVNAQSVPALPRTSGERRRLVIDGLVLPEADTPLSLNGSVGDVISVEGDGAARAALFHSLTGLRSVTPGTIRIDGHDLAALGDRLRRQLIGVAGPDYPLLAGSLAMNLHYRHPYAEDAAWREHARAWLIDHAANDANSSHNSAGGRAGLALARALLNRPKLLILDGADADLGPEQLDRLRADLAGYPGVVLLHSTQPAIRAMASRIWVLGANGASLERETDGPIDNLVHLRERNRA